MKLSVLLTWLLLLPTSSLASTEDLQKRVFSASTAPRGVAAMGAAGRLELARVSLTYWKSFDGRIPRNSPSDQRWLEAELDTTDSARIGRAINSPQYALWRLSTRSSNCVTLFESLVAVVGVDRITELYYWLKVTSCWQDAADTAQYLKIAGLANGRLDDTFKMQFFSYALSAINGAVANGAASAETIP